MRSAFYLWLWRSATQQLRRFIMLLLFVASGVALLQLTLTLDRAFSLQASDSQSGDNRLLVLNALSSQMPLPQFYQQKIAALPDVGQVSWGVWVGAYYRHPGWFVPAVAIEDRHYFSMLSSLKIAPAVLERWQHDRQGVLVDSRFAAQYHLKAGDRLPLSSSIWQLAPNPILDLYITGIVEETQTDNPPAVWMHYDYLENARQNGKGLVSFFMVMPNPGVSAENAAREIDRQFSAERMRGMTQTAPVRMQMKLFMSKLFNFNRVIFWVNLSLCLLLALLLSTNFYVMTQKAQDDYRTLSYLGFGKARLIKAVALQLAAITLIGAAVGVLLSLFILFLLPVFLPSVLSGVTPYWQDYLASILLILALSLCCGLPSLLQIARLREEGQ
ncbi:ABC transporter permease [Erwinia sp. MYb375]|uniref:ABC transporter permease n=1 Tax=unclassified Erwinia TaxID=2622719 RepID=UPI0030A062B8